MTAGTRVRGITYDTGFVNGTSTTRKVFDADVVWRELKIVRDDLHCTAVRPTGGDADRLEVAARLAAELGLEVWYSPFPCDQSESALLDHLLDAAERAEHIRRALGTEIVFVAGAEITFANPGFLPGASIVDRLRFIAPLFEAGELSPEASARLNEFFADAMPLVRRSFGGRVSYASAWGERVDWTPFDFVGIDAYRSATMAPHYQQALRSLHCHGKRVAVTEFGSSTYRGSAAKGVAAEDIVVWRDAEPEHLSADVERDEQEQADAIRTMWQAFVSEHIDTAFAHTLGFWHMPYDEDPRRDLDRAGYGIVRPLPQACGVRYPDMAWEPKLAFDVLAGLYRQ